MKSFITCLCILFSLMISGVSFAVPQAQAIFAGGCFWCMQPPYDKLSGVISTTAGYIGGNKPNPTYQSVSSGQTNYAEAVKIIYNPNKINYQLLTVFWRNIDPTRNDGQFCDSGREYRPEIFYLNPQQKKLAEESKQQIIDSDIIKKPIKVAITKAGKFYPAETYHQDYYKKNPVRYKLYRYACGRDKRLNELWGKKTN